jgi:hypothetical protein
MKDSGSPIIKMERAMKSFKMAASIKVTMSMVSLKGLENINGRTESFIKENG